MSEKTNSRERREGRREGGRHLRKHGIGNKGNWWGWTGGLRVRAEEEDGKVREQLADSFFYYYL